MLPWIALLASVSLIPNIGFAQGGMDLSLKTIERAVSRAKWKSSWLNWSRVCTKMFEEFVLEWPEALATFEVQSERENVSAPLVSALSGENGNRFLIINNQTISIDSKSRSSGIQISDGWGGHWVSIDVSERGGTYTPISDKDLLLAKIPCDPGLPSEVGREVSIHQKWTLWTVPWLEIKARKKLERDGSVILEAQFVSPEGGLIMGFREAHKGGQSRFEIAVQPASNRHGWDWRSGTLIARWNDTLLGLSEEYTVNQYNQLDYEDALEFQNDTIGNQAKVIRDHLKWFTDRIRGL